MPLTFGSTSVSTVRALIRAFIYHDARPLERGSAMNPPQQPPFLPLDPGRLAQRPRTAEDDEAAIIKALAGTVELVANIVKMVDASDPFGVEACNAAADWVRLNLRAFSPAQLDSFWGELAKAVFGEYGDSMEWLERLERPGRTRGGELPNQTMFYRACRRRADLMALSKPLHKLGRVEPDVFHIGSYVFALLGDHTSFVSLGTAKRWIDRILHRLTMTGTDTPCMLLRDSAFATAFMRRAFSILTRDNPDAIRIERRIGWMLRTARAYFAELAAWSNEDPASVEFKRYIYRNSVPSDWGELSSVTAPLSDMRRNLTTAGKLLMSDVTFVANMLRCDKMDVFLFLPVDSMLWSHPDVIGAVRDSRLDPLMNREEKTRWDAALVDFVQLAYFVHEVAPDDWRYWTRILSCLDTFYGDLLPYAMSYDEWVNPSARVAWDAYIRTFLMNHRDGGDEQKRAKFFVDVCQYLHTRDLFLIHNVEFWSSIMMLGDPAAPLRALRTVPGSIGHDQPTLARFVGNAPRLLDHADEFHFEDTPQLAALLGNYRFVQHWARVSKRSMPLYFRGHERVVRSFSMLLAANPPRKSGGFYYNTIAKLLDSLPIDDKTFWMQAISREAAKVPPSDDAEMPSVSEDESALYM